MECKTKRLFAIAFLGKKLVFHTEICDYFQYLNFKYIIFHREKELFKSNQTGYGVYHGYLESISKRIFAIACLGKKLALHTEICEFCEERILKIGLFHRAKNFLKLNQTRYGVSHVYLKCKTKKMFAKACLGKK